MTVVQTLSTAQLADRWGVTQNHLRRLRMNGQGPPYFRPSGGEQGRVRYRLADILEWEKERQERRPAAR